MHNVAIIGDGGWGTALAVHLARAGHRVRVWGPFPDVIEQIRTTNENRDYLPGVALLPAITWTHDRNAAVEAADTVVLAVPTRYFRDVVGGFKGLIPPGARIVSVAKGLQADTGRRMTETARETLGCGPVAALSGPSHAEEVAREIPTAVTVAAEDAQLCDDLQAVFSSRRFRVYTSDDVVGVELGGALKNVIAVAVGVCDGLGFGDNTRAALITRGLAEITRLGVALGARPLTFAGLSGMGDLIVTCTSRHSRNRGVGERIGRGESVADILGGMKQVAEGIVNCKAAHELARATGVDVPITGEVDRIVHHGKTPRDAVDDLLSRDSKPEYPESVLAR